MSSTKIRAYDSMNMGGLDELILTLAMLNPIEIFRVGSDIPI